MKVTSPAGLIWRRFAENRMSVVGLLVIALLCLLSLFANLLVYDHTPGADLQYPTLSLQPAGFTTAVLEIAAIRDPSVSWWQKISTGYARSTTHVPYRSIRSRDETHLTYVDHYGKLHQLRVETLLSEPGAKEVTFWLGTDRYGRSIWSRLIRGVRISLFVGAIAVIISLTIGILLGLLAGYFGSWIDAGILFLINVTWSIPTLLLVFAIVLAMGRGVTVIFVAVGLTMWVEVARVVRGQTLQLRDAQYVVAARSLGISTTSVLFRHLLPNIVGPILVLAAANFATAILVEAGLSYLGFGVSPPTPSLGNILNEHYGYAVSGKVMLAIVPALVIMVLVLAFNIVGAGLRDAFDVKG